MAASLTPLRSIADLEQALLESAGAPVLLFKHSRSCGTSHMALAELKQHLAAASTPIRCGIITVQTERDLSNEAAARLGVPHRTPQAILIRNARVVWHASHFQITADALRAALADHA